MLVGIISDTHDNNDNTKRVLDEIVKRGARYVLHLGDICAPTLYYDVLSKYTDKLKFIMVFGNNDGEKVMWTRISMECEAIDMAQGDFRELELEGRKIFMTHYPEIAELAALSRKYDAVFHGHTHLARKEVIGDTLLVNPGETVASRTGKISFAVWDTEKNDAEIIYLS